MLSKLKIEWPKRGTEIPGASECRDSNDESKVVKTPTWCMAALKILP